MWVELLLMCDVCLIMWSSLYNTKSTLYAIHLLLLTVVCLHFISLNSFIWDVFTLCVVVYILSALLYNVLLKKIVGMIVIYCLYGGL